MGDVVLGAVGFVGVVMIAAAIAGLLIGIVVVMVKRSRDRAAGPTDPGRKPGYVVNAASQVLNRSFPEGV